MLAASAGLCVTTTMVVPRCLLMAKKRSWICSARRRVEVARRLVGEQELRLEQQRARERHALLLAAGELARAVQDALLQPHLFEQRARACVSSSRLERPWTRPGIITFSTRVELGQQVVELEDEPDGPVAQLGEARSPAAP